MIWTIWIVLSGLLGGTAVIFGAFAAHALKAKVSVDLLAVFETGARYQIYHALALIGVGLISTRVENLWITLSGISFTLGCFLFSGSLYALTLFEHRWLGMITPIGGLALIFGWLCLVISVLQI